MHDRAVKFATKAHAGQVRNLPDGKSEDYVMHVLRVAGGVHVIGGSPTAVVAAILHDTVEDTDTTLADIEREFGSEVARMVDGLSDKFTKETHPDLNRKARKDLELARISHESEEVHLVKLVDLLDNLRDTPADKGFGKGFSEEAGALLAILRGPESLRAEVERERLALRARHDAAEAAKKAAKAAKAGP
jgi:(p)ppGpp synthase/HD superfamily hydrolase